MALVGPDPWAHGGVAGYELALLSSALADRFDLVPVATHRDGTRRAKLAQGLRGLARLRRLCARGELDLVHLNTSWRGSLVRKTAALLVASRHGCPVVLQLHGSDFERGLRRPGLRGALARRAVGAVARWADAVVAATPAWAAEVSALLGLPEVSVVPNTALVASPSRAEPDNGTRTVLFFGRLTRAKGVGELLDAFAGLRADRPHLRLVLAGDGPERVALAASAAAHGLDGSVELPGWVAGEEKQRLLASAACLVLPSYAEGLPLALLEGLLAGRPVVATRVGGVPEAVRDGQEALLVPPRDAPALTGALARILDEPALAERLAQAGQARALAEFGPGRVAAELGALYDRVLARRGVVQAAAAAGALVASTTSSSQRSTE